MSIRKIINIFIVFLSVFVFSIDYNTLSKIEYENMNNLIDTIGRNEELDIIQLELEKKDESFFNDLVKYVTNKGNTTIISRSTQNNDLSINQNYYLYTKDTDKTLSSIFIRNNKKINFDNKNEEYYSTNLKEECYDHIDYLNKNYHKSYNHIIHMYQLNRLSKDSSEDNSYYVYIYTNDKDETIKEIENSKLNRYLSENWKNNEYTKIVPSNYDDSLSLKFLMISSITILLLYICETIKVKKEIMVRKMFGMGNVYIITKLFLKRFIMNSLIYLSTNIVCFFLVVGHLRSVTHNFLISQAKFLLTFTLFQIVLYFIIYLFIRNMKDINQTSNLSNKQTVYLNICLKIIVVSVIMLPMIQFVELGVKEIRSAAFLINNKENLKNQVFINGVNEVDDKDLTTVIDELKIYFNEKDAIYQDFFQNEMEDDLNKEKEPYLIVNKNYLKQYNILDENGVKLNYNQLENNTLLIPEKYKSLETSDYCDGQTCNVILVKNGMVYKNRDPMTALNNLFYKKDPIILLKNSVDSSCKWSYPYLLLEANKSEISHIRSDLDNKGLLNAVELESTDSRYEIVMEEIKDNCLYLIPLFFVYIFVVLTFLYQNIYIYFINNKEMFALKYLFGNSFFERHGKMILVNISVYVLPLLYGLYYQKIKLIYLFIFIFLAILFELISAFILIKRFEKNRIVNVLKGE